MTNTTTADPGIRKSQILAMAALSLIVVTAITILSDFIGLSTMQTVKISIGYIILGGMVVDQAIDFGA